MAKILVVDDDQSILNILQWTFEGAGHEVVATLDPRDVLKLIAEHDFDAVTIDAVMPELSGWDLLEQLRREPGAEDLPILMLTSLGEVENRVRGLRSGADDYLVKPFEPIELLARVEVLIAHYAEIRDARGDEPDAEPRDAGLAAALSKIEQCLEAGESLEGLRLGRYEILELFKSGPAGCVMRGWDPKLQRPVVLKTISSEHDASRRERQIFHLIKEGAAGARFSHPNIVAVYDVGDEGNAAFLAMEYVDGIDLRRRLAASPPLEHGSIPPIAAAIARALAAAHENNLLHRDIKPSNVLLGREGAIKVTDFGIAEWTTRAGRPGQIAGTAGYIAPECLDGGGNSPASDLFSLGVVLYECYTGSNPFDGETWEQRAERTLHTVPPDLARIYPELRGAVGETVAGLLQRDPQRRLGDAARVAQIFEDLAGERNLTFKPLAGVGSGAFDLPREIDTPTLDLHVDEEET